MTPNAIWLAYEEGLPGCHHNQETLDEFWASQPDAYFTDACPHLAGTGTGKRALLWRSRELYDPGAFGRESQTTGDCVSHGSRNARDTTRAVEIHIQKQPEEYFLRGATEPTYGARGHGGEGMDPARASRFERDTGWLYRQKYDGVVDLSKYDSDIGSRWGRGGVPDEVKILCNKFKVGRFILPVLVSDCMDLMANGYAGHSGQSWGTGSLPSSDGLNRKKGSWNHDMATVGYDDTKEVFPETCFFVANSWGAWNQQNPKWDERVLGPWIPGMIVVPADEYERYFIDSGSIFYYADIDGVPAKTLPDWGFTY